jgi:hypothetical protein
MPILPALLAASQLMAVPAPSSRTCIAIDVVAAEQERRATRKRSFSATETLDLELRTWLRTRRQTEGDHVLRLKLFTPRGYLYQEMTVPFHADPPPARWWRWRQDENGVEAYEPTRTLPGFSTPVSVQKTRWVWKGRRPFNQVTARLPVAGTSITMGSLFGRWTVVPFLDDETAPCGRSRTFVIRK